MKNNSLYNLKPKIIKIFNLLTFLILIISSLIFFEKNFFIQIDIFNFISSRTWRWCFLIDLYSLIFSLIVLIITIFIFFYSLSYLETEGEKPKFFISLFIFIISMIILIYSFNLTSLLIRWDGLGVTSFLLIFFYHSIKRKNSSLITIILNRIGDLIIIFSLTLSLIYFTWNIIFWFSCQKLTIIMLLIASFRKSAQIPFSAWLPLAIAAPTPVSSLVHSSTLVTAGIYLIFRIPYRCLFNFKKLIFLISRATLLLRSFIALQRFDLKEIIAFSTIRHISLIIIGLSWDYFNISFFHLCTHALFKALLFICSGFLIYFQWGSQDIRNLSLIQIRPKIKFAFIIASCSIMGLPFLSGFYSKDILIDLSSTSRTIIIFSLSILITRIYSLRLLFYLSNSKSNLKIKINEFINKTIYIILWFSIFAGSVIQWSLFSLSFTTYLQTLKFLIFIIFIFRLLIIIYKIKINFNFIYYLRTIWKVNFFLIKFSSCFNILEKGWLYLPVKILSNCQNYQWKFQILSWSIMLIFLFF